jgi:hypothetical protein
MKRFLSILLVFALVLGMCSMTACQLLDLLFPKEDSPKLTPSEGLDYKLLTSQNSYTVWGVGTCKDEDIVIPETYKGLSVTSIADMAFYENENIKSVYIPSSVEEIGELAFAYCKNLENVTLNEGIKTLKGRW